MHGSTKHASLSPPSLFSDHHILPEQGRGCQARTVAGLVQRNIRASIGSPSSRAMTRSKRIAEKSPEVGDEKAVPISAHAPPRCGPGITTDLKARIESDESCMQGKHRMSQSIGLQAQTSNQQPAPCQH